MDKFVIVKHKTINSRCYLFRVPDDIELLAGDVVVCDNLGKAEATCVCDSFFTTHGDEVIRMMNASRARLKSVTAVRTELSRSEFIQPHQSNSGVAEPAGISLAEML